MALGDYTKTTYVTRDTITDTKLNNNENETEELDTALNSHVGSGGSAHANVVAGGAAGFMTGADKTKLDGLNQAKGTWADTSTVISASSSYTKNIALGFNATRGRVITKGYINNGAVIFFDTTANNSIAYFVISNAGDNSEVRNKGIDGLLTNHAASPYQCIFSNAYVDLIDCYINGTNLTLVFQNTDPSNPRTLSVQQLLWEVE